MTIGIWVLGDQLWTGQSALSSRENNKQKTPVLLIESRSYAQQRPYHRQKLVLVWSAMRHFSAELRSAGWSVTHEIADDFDIPLLRWIEQNQITELLVMKPNDRSFIELINNLKLPCKLTFIANNHFLWSAEEFKQWASSRKGLLMENFYREGRKRFHILMDGKKPVGGQWNLDKQNRRPPKGNLETPPALWFEPDEITQQVIDDVKSSDWAGYGEIEPFCWGVTRADALAVLEHFLTTRLADFGPFQDAMVTGEETMWHSLISPYLNLGLLTPIEVIHAVEQVYQEESVPLNSVEGLIRQVLGWREYINGVYHLMDDDYDQSNWFNHNEPLPDFYWDSSQTQMNCLSQILSQVERTGYAHHIQRLMVLSNFALIAGVSPQEINHWFQSAFIDAYEWVMIPNVIGMGQFADGGILASKPYASSANYINKMSTYCGDCVYNPRQRTGDKACPFNFLYWDFLARHQDSLKSQGRMNLVLANLKRMNDEELEEIKAQADYWRQKMGT